MNDSILTLCRLSPTRRVWTSVIDLQRFAKKLARRRRAKLAGRWQRARLRRLGRKIPWNLSRTRATQLLRELRPVSLVESILDPFTRRDKFKRNQQEVRKRITRLVARAGERGVPHGVVRYEGRKYADALTATPRTFEQNLAMEEAIERSGLSAGKYYMRGLRNSP